MGTGSRSARHRRKDNPLPPPGGYLRKNLEAQEFGPHDIRRAIHQGELQRVGYGVYNPSSVHQVSSEWALLQALACDSRHLATGVTAATLWGIHPGQNRGENLAADRPTVTAVDLEEAVRSRGRAVGIGTAREVAPLARPGADSFPESMLRYYVLQSGLPEPEVNPLIGDRSSSQCFRPDLAFREWRVSVQYEGTGVHSDPERVLRDIRRAEVTARLGWVEVRITKEHMRDGGRAACTKIRAALIAQGCTPPDLKDIPGVPRS